VRRFCRDIETVPRALETVRRRLRDREHLLLRVLERTVFGRPRSPYSVLLRSAGCEPGDVERLVHAEGVEGALETLRRAGVYVSFEEFKGLAPAVRGSQRFEFRPRDFDNPLLTPYLSLTSGGSRARPTRIIIDLDYLAESAPHWALWFEAHGWIARELTFVTAYYPSIVNRQLRCARIGKPYDRWFVTAQGGSRAYGLGSAWIHWTARHASGAPPPSTVALDRLEPVVAALAEGAEGGKPACVHTTPTTAARLCVTATRLGRSLAGVAFWLGGEPHTDARRRSIEAAGARGVPGYGSSEAAPVGVQCPRPAETDAVHVFTDLYATLPDRRPLVDGRHVDGILLTGLLRAGPKVLLNTDIGDVGRVERRSCECLLGQLGYDTHLSHIRSFQKLTGDGATFLGPDLYPLLEDVLPRRFGGATGDYQLLERQDAQGVSRYQLLVSPGIGPIVESELVQAFFEGLESQRPAYGFMVDQWRRGGFLEVRRERPRVSARGKVPSVQTLAGPDRSVP
jgi:acyl-CoA synthetase (AMP-forming)/AMP-acid ligase II